MFRPSATLIRALPRRCAPLALCGLALAAAGCGGGGDAQARDLRLDAAADGSLRFERGSLRAPAGRTAIEMRNPSQIPHAIAIRGNGIRETGQTVGNGETSRVVVDLKPGSYTLVCPVGGHEQAGMVARLMVEQAAAAGY